MFQLKTINRKAVLVAWVAAMVMGSLWYGPLFGKPWMAAVGIDPSTVSPMLPMFVMVGAYLALAFIVALFISGLKVTTAKKGLGVGLVLSLFYAITLLVNVLFENRPFNLFLINGLYAPIEFGLMGAIIGGWKKKG